MVMVRKCILSARGLEKYVGPMWLNTPSLTQLAVYLLHSCLHYLWASKKKKAYIAGSQQTDYVFNKKLGIFG